MLLFAVCVTAGYLMSFWNRPFFPEWCSHGTLDDPTTYDTMVRIAGSYFGFAQTFKAVADHYGWTHIVLLSDDDTSKICWFGAKSFEKVFRNDKNYSFTWLRYGSRPTDKNCTFTWLRYGSRPTDKNYSFTWLRYSFTWLRYGSRPTDEEMDDILQQIRALTRGLTLADAVYIFVV